jgi:hypothetical protein
MSNPLKLSSPIAPPDVSNIGRGSKALKAAISVTSAKVKGPLKISPELLEIFSKTAKSHEESVAQAKKDGSLDKHGNPIGTQYWDPEDATTIKRKSNGPRRRIKIKAGMTFGELTVLRKGPKVKASRPNLVERWRCSCSCGKHIIVPKYYLLRKPNPKTHCGHQTATLKSLNQREYRIWMMIHQRCYNPKHVSYAHYKAKGITLFPEWHKDNKDGFEKFLAHVGNSPSQWHSLDRINNNKGYFPGNLKWSTAAEQRANQGDRIGGYTSEEIADMGYTEEEFIEKILTGEIQ